MKTATYTQIYIHLVFSPRGRQSLISDNIQDTLYSYISETINKKKHKTYIINGMPDHIHILVGLNPSVSLSELVRDVKRSSALFINTNKLVQGKFQWQEGFGAFTYGKSQIQTVYDYIKNQKIHHEKMKFKEEYIGLLDRFGIDYDEKFIFESYD